MVNQFNEHLHRFHDEQLKPWGILRYRVALANLERHLDGEDLDVLDAGGGNGLDALALAEKGHRVTLMDPAGEMLAEARRLAGQAGLGRLVTTLQGGLESLSGRFGAARFDALLCHNVIQYLDDVDAALDELLSVLAPGGLLSIISLNRYSESFRRAVQQKDLQAALEALEARRFRTVTFDTAIQAYSAQEIADRLAALGCQVLGQYGIRCVCDYIPDNRLKFEADSFARLEKLELAMSGQHPYNLLGRNFQVIARKTG